MFGNDMTPGYGVESASIDVDEREMRYGERNLAEDLEFWMTRLPARLRMLPIIQLAIPGSHNTMTYTIDRHNEVGPDESALIRAVGRYFPIVAKPVIFNWSVNQLVSVTEQLNGGIRYLDLRVAGKPREPSRVYFLHGLYGAEVEQPLRELADWLAGHPNEIVVLDFQHFYDFDEARHRGLVDRVRQLFRGRMCPVQPRLDDLSLDRLAAQRYQLVVVYRHIVAREYHELWPSGLWPTPWPNTVNVTKLVNFLNEGLKSRRRDVGYVSQCLLTPNVSYILKHICGSLHKDLSTLCRSVSLPWIEQCTPGSGGLNIVITDYVSYDNFLFSKIVIQRNATLLKS